MKATGTFKLLRVSTLPAHIPPPTPPPPPCAAGPHRTARTRRHADTPPPPPVLLLLRKLTLQSLLIFRLKAPIVAFILQPVQKDLAERLTGTYHTHYQNQDIHSQFLHIGLSCRIDPGPNHTFSTTTRYLLSSKMRYPWQWVSIVVAEQGFCRNPNFRASGSVRRHCPLPFLLLPLSLVSLVCSVVLSPSLRSPSSPSPQATLSPISLSRMYVCMHACIYVCM